MIISGSRFDKLVIFVVAVDLLFFPYIRVLSASLSMLILPIWFVVRSKIVVNDAELRLGVFALLIVALSFLQSFITYQSGFLLRDGREGSPTAMLANTVITSLMFLYYFFFKSVISRYKINIEKLLLMYVIFATCLAAIFFYDPALYFKVRSFWTMSGDVIDASGYNSMHRFTSTLSDPNNFSALICAVLAYLLFSDWLGYLVKLLVTMSVGVAVLASMSTSGLAIYIFVVLVFMIKEAQGARHSRYHFIVTLFTIFSSAFVLLVFFFNIQDSQVAQVALERASDNSLSSRYAIWQRSLDVEKLILSFFWGDGGLVIMDGRVVNPHNGHLHFLYSYGVIFYFIFIYLFFLKDISYLSTSSLFLIPIAICFTINVGFYELRFAGATALLVAAYKSRGYKLECDARLCKT
jgi:hypothetical protein